VVEAPVERAFKAFTEDFDRVKPREHNMLPVQLEHRYLDRHGEGWEGLRQGVGGADGWPLYLQRYAALFDR
jgi:hypothetical protein